MFIGSLNFPEELKNRKDHPDHFHLVKIYLKDMIWKMIFRDAQQKNHR